ncbi:unnamed protein product, partial [Staurois parvus]
SVFVAGCLKYGPVVRLNGLHKVFILVTDPEGIKVSTDQGRTDHLSTRALPKGPGSVGGGPMRFPWYLFIGFFWVWFLSVDEDTGPMIPLLPRGPMSYQSAPVLD